MSEQLPYIDNGAMVEDKYIAQETYQCLNPQCKFRWRGNAGPNHCVKCGSIEVHWETFKTDWSDYSGVWKRVFFWIKKEE